MRFDYEFKGNKPSKASIKKIVLSAIDKGNDEISLSWGEHWMDFKSTDLYGGLWMGFGWIKDIDGSKIADEITLMQKNKTLNLWNS